MEIGLILGNLNLPTGREAIETAAREADQMGFDSVWLADHIVMPIRPIWIGGWSEAAMRRAVRQGDGWYVPRRSIDGIRPFIERIHEMAAEEGRDLSDFTFANRLTVRFADEPTDELPERVRRPVQNNI